MTHNLKALAAMALSLTLVTPVFASSRSGDSVVAVGSFLGGGTAALGGVILLIGFFCPGTGAGWGAPLVITGLGVMSYTGIEMTTRESRRNAIAQALKEDSAAFLASEESTELLAQVFLGIHEELRKYRQPDVTNEQIAQGLLAADL